MDADTCEIVLEASSLKLDANEAACAVTEAMGDTTDSSTTDEALGTASSTTTEDATDAMLEAEDATCSVTDEAATDASETTCSAAEDATEAALDADGRYSFKVATGFVVGMTAGSDSDSETTSGRTEEADPTTASDAAGGVMEDEDATTEETKECTDALAWETEAETVLRTCAKGVVASPLPSSLTRSQIFLTCGSTNWRRCSPRNCAN